MIDVLVIGAGSAGVLAAVRAADLGARTVLVSSAAFGGIAANDGPVPVRTLAHAARLLRAARKVGQYGIDVSRVAREWCTHGVREPPDAAKNPLVDIGGRRRLPSIACPFSHHRPQTERGDKLRISGYQQAVAPEKRHL